MKHIPLLCFSILAPASATVITASSGKDAGSDANVSLLGSRHISAESD
jgi:hypothetical protein